MYSALSLSFLFFFFCEVQRDVKILSVLDQSFDKYTCVTQTPIKI